MRNLIVKILIFFGVNRCDCCGWWTRKWAKRMDEHIVCWDCRDHEIVPGFQP